MRQQRASSSDKIPAVTSDETSWEIAQREYERDKAFLDDFHAKRQQRMSQVRDIFPEAEFPIDLVSNGPPPRHRLEASLRHLFLWLNAKLGADFASRFARFEEQCGRTK